MIDRRAFFAILTLLAGGLCLPACQKQQNSKKNIKKDIQEKPSAAVSGGTLYFELDNLPSIDPKNAQFTESCQVVSLLFDPLIRYNFETSELEGLAAQSWKVNESATQFIFQLQKGKRFHNGDPVTAQDFKFAWERLALSVSENKAFLTVRNKISLVTGFNAFISGEAEEIAGLFIPDDLTLEVNLERPCADFPYIISHPAFSPIPVSVKGDGEETFSTLPIGNGPFMLKEAWKKDKPLKLEKFQSYSDDIPYLDSIEFISTNKDSQAKEMFENGSLDFRILKTQDVDSMTAQYGESDDGYVAEPGKQTLLGPRSQITFLAFNLESKKMRKLSFRQALSCAINQSTICEKLSYNFALPAQNLVTPGLAESNVVTNWTYATYDLDRAKAFLENAGFEITSNNQEAVASLNLICFSDNFDVAVARQVAKDLSNLQISVNIEPLKWNEFIQRLGERSYDMAIIEWVYAFSSAGPALFDLFYSQLPYNYFNLKDSSIDKLIYEMESKSKESDREAALADVNKKISEICPLVPLCYKRHNALTSNRVNELMYYPNGVAALERCWVSDGI